MSYPDICKLVHADAVDFLDGFDFTGDELVYADPPYVAATRRQQKIYRHEYDDAAHERLLAKLLLLPCMVMLSGYDNPLYAHRLGHWRSKSFQATTQTGLRTETVWFNFSPPERLHDASFLGTDFRERQSVKRRHERLIERFNRMNPVERHHVLELLNAKFASDDHEFDKNFALSLRREAEAVV